MNDKNLIPYVKGKSGNPKGRPKGAVGLTARLKKMLTMKLTNYDPLKDEEVTQSIKNHIIDIFLSKAMNGEDKAICEIFNRIEGKAKLFLEHSGPDKQPLVDYSNLSPEKLEELYNQQLAVIVKGGK